MDIYSNFCTKKFYTSIAISILIFLSIPTTSQPSFQIVMDNSGHWLDDAMINQQDQIAIMISDTLPGLSKSFYLFPISGQTGLLSGWEIQLDGSAATGNTKKTSYYDDQVCFSLSIVGGQEGSLNCVNIETGESWAKKILNSFIQSAVFTHSGNEITLINSPEEAGSPISVYPDKGTVELFNLDKDGNTLWKRGMIFKYGSPSVSCDVISKEIRKAQNGDFYITGSMHPENTPESFQYIARLDSVGNPLILKTIKGHAIGKMIVTHDGVYLLDKGFYENFWYLDPFESVYAVLIKLDLDLNFKWAKKYFADNFPYSNANILEDASGNLLMSHSTIGAFPIILIKIDTQGNILTQKGYPNHTPRMYILNNGSFLFASRQNFDDTGQTFFQPVIAKTDPEGNIMGCSTYPTCLKSEDISIEMGDDFEVEFIDIYDLEEREIMVSPISFSFSEYCNFPPAPLPDFNFPSPLCLNDTASTTHTYNRLANAREWRLTGPGVDSVLVDSFNFSYRFTMPGEYLLRQTVWVLGCSSSFEKNITVLPPLEAAIAPAHLCPDEPQTLHVETNRPVSSYAWNTGDSTATLPVQASGTYTVQVSDGACLAADTLEVEVVSEWIGSQTPLQLPPDTTVCHTDLPFRLVPQSPFTDSFFLANDLVTADTFYLQAPGDYHIGMTAFGCYFYENFTLEVDCRADVYLPNVFSPNGDGINDEFYPMGTDFEVLELSIFDRWGGLRYRGSGPGARWAGGRATQGTYVYRLVFEDLLSGKREVLTGEVTLVR